jgi:hypothetical protein
MLAPGKSWRYGAPQVFAALLLLLFLLQAGVFIAHVPLSQAEGNRILRGIALARGARQAEPWRSPLADEAAVAGILPVVLGSPPTEVPAPATLDRYRWLVRAPFLLAGLLLGASVWHVARRLYGNPGGYVAIGLYCFTPALVARSSLAGPEILGAWGAFGTVFTAIAVAHTLYAPRPTLFWNRKRIALLGTAIAMMVGAQFSLALLLPLALAFMLWAVPERRGAAATILAAACLAALVLLWIVYGTSIVWLGRALTNAQWIAFSRPAFPATLAAVASFYSREASAAALLSVVALFCYLLWPRTRFFGNTAPLLVMLEIALLAILTPTSAGAAFFFYCLPFLIVFTAGVFADLFESRRYRAFAVAGAYSVILAQAGFSLVGLVHLARGF